jgi:endoglucanase
MDELLKKLTEAHGVSGDEDEIREILKQEAVNLADEVSIDKMGNLVAFKKGTKGGKKIMLCAHMDEVGLIIHNIADNGTLKFSTVGSIDPRVLISKKVRIGKKKHPGILGLKAIHLQEPEERKNVVKTKQLYIDIGAKSKDEALKIINLGDYAAFDTEYLPFGHGRIKAKALDDRLGCSILLDALKNRYPYDLYACFTVQEEIGIRGAGAAAFSIKPTMALIVEGTTCSDVPGVDEHMRSTRLGKGPAITVMDATSYSNKHMVSKLIETAIKENIPYQMKESVTGGNDAGAIHVSGEGIKTAVVSVPCRYIHSPVSVADINDYYSTSRLVEAFLKGCE